MSYKPGDVVKVKGHADIPDGQYEVVHQDKDLWMISVVGHSSWICALNSCDCSKSAKVELVDPDAMVSCVQITGSEEVADSLFPADYVAGHRITPEPECVCKSLMVGHDSTCAWKAAQ